MTFTESNTVEQMILDAASGLAGTPRRTAQQDLPLYKRDSGGRSPRWSLAPAVDVPRQPGEVMVESWVREALVKLNPEIVSRYSFQDSIRDKATLPLHFEAPEVRLKIDRAAIDEAFAQSSS